MSNHEWNLLWQQPTRIVPTFLSTISALVYSQHYGVSIGNSFWGSNNGNKADAFRHYCWNQLLISNVALSIGGPDAVSHARNWAKMYTDAHEDYTNLYGADGEDPINLSHAMDYNNNNVARNEINAYVRWVPTWWFFGYFDVVVPSDGEIRNNATYKANSAVFVSKNNYNTYESNNYTKFGYVNYAVYINN